MPKIDGIKVFKEIRKLNSAMRILFSSGYAESEKITELRGAGGVDFIQKPYRKDTLIQKIVRLSGEILTQS
jgi:FixJ family two-component response regulator